MTVKQEVTNARRRLEPTGGRRSAVTPRGLKDAITDTLRVELCQECLGTEVIGHTPGTGPRGSA
jgi:hypothetical protein